MIEIEINNNSYKVPIGDMVIQACSRAGIEIPRFCFHEKLTIAGNCRMCLVELGYPKSLKPIASCAMPIVNGMKIFTETFLVKKAREGVLEFLLANHPLDCPICDQGGECDLQDETLVFGNDRGRFYETKRSVEDKDLGPIIKTVMTRCIQCTRCVRYFSEISGQEFIGTLGRGSFMEIGNFIEKNINTEISGNVIDLCPVGALTSKPYAFNARPWELRSFQGIDVLDSFGSNIRIDLRGTEIVRILPLQNTLSNEEWITDKIRFAYNGLKFQRFHTPLIQINKIFVNISWKRILNILSNIFKYFYDISDKNKFISSFFKKNSQQYVQIKGVTSKLSDIESIVCFKDFLNIYGSSDFCYENLKNNIFNIDFRDLFITKKLMKTWDEVFKKADNFFFINFNPRLEFPIFNVKVSRIFNENNVNIFTLGSSSYFNYFTINIGNNIMKLLNLLEGKSLFSRKLLLSKSPLILYKKFNSLFFSDLFNNINLLKKYIKLYKEDWKGFHIISEYMGEINASEVGFVSLNINNYSSNFEENNIVYSMGAQLKGLKKNYKKRVFLIYQASNGDDLALNADMILPTATFFEKIGSFLNFDGLLQKTKNVVVSPGTSRLDFDIFFMILALQHLVPEYNKKFLVQEDFISNRMKQISPLLEKIVYAFSSFKDNTIFLNVQIYIYYGVFLSSKFTMILDCSLTQSSQILNLIERRLFNKNANFLQKDG